MTDQTTHDVDKYVSAKGTEFKVEQRPNGLYFIDMKRGGVKPPICDELFTTRRFAEDKLIKYLKRGDKFGYAEYPGKEVKVGTSEDE